MILQLFEVWSHFENKLSIFPKLNFLETVRIYLWCLVAVGLLRFSALMEQAWILHTENGKEPIFSQILEPERSKFEKPQFRNFLLPG